MLDNYGKMKMQITLISWEQEKLPKSLGIGFTIATNPYVFEDGSIPNQLLVSIFL